MEPQGTERKEDPSEQYAEGGEETAVEAETDAAAETDSDAEVEAEPEAEVEVEADAEAESDDDPLLRHNRLKSVMESLLFASDKPLPLKRMGELTGTRDGVLLQATLDALVAEYQDRGIMLCEVAGGWQFRTAAANSEWVQQLVGGRPVRLSRAQLETMAIVAYRQPITRPEIDDIRGVDSGGTLKVLLDRNLIRVLGKKEEPGRPLLYGSTKEFLEFFNLSDLRELPTLREYHELTEDSMRVVERMGMSLDDLPGKGTIAADDAEGEVTEDAGEGAEVTEDAGEVTEAPESEPAPDATAEVADEIPAAPATDPLHETEDASPGDETSEDALPDDEASVEASAGEPEAAPENAPTRSDNEEDEAPQP